MSTKKLKWLAFAVHAATLAALPFTADAGRERIEVSGGGRGGQHFERSYNGNHENNYHEQIQKPEPEEYHGHNNGPNIGHNNGPNNGSHGQVVVPHGRPHIQPNIRPHGPSVEVHQGNRGHYYSHGKHYNYYNRGRYYNYYNHGNYYNYYHDGGYYNYYHNGNYYVYFNNGAYYNYFIDGMYYLYFVNGQYYNYFYDGVYYKNCIPSRRNPDLLICN